MELCEVLGIEFIPEPPRDRYSRGWGNSALNSLPIICSWSLQFQDIQNSPVRMTFDLANDDSPLIIGMDVQQFASSNFLDNISTFKIRRPQDNIVKILPVYISGRNKFNKRAYLDIIGLVRKANTLMATNRGSYIRPLTLAKRIHRYSHAPPRDMIEMLTRTGCPREQAEVISRKIAESCLICSQTGLPLPTRKVSLTHVSEAFNSEIQADYMFVYIRKDKFCVLHVVDAGTGYSEAKIVEKRSIEIMVTTLETIWVHRHGAPQSFSADSEFTKHAMKLFLKCHNIKLNERPVRRHNKTGIIERKNRTIKTILERLEKDMSFSSHELILSRATFLSNMFSGSTILSSFELARGYKPAILGVHSKLVSQDLLEAYKDQVVTRAIQRLLKSRTPRTVTPQMLPAGTDVFYFYKSSKQNEPVEWKPGKIHSTHPHFVTVWTENNRRSNIAYEDIRIKPQNILAGELSSGYVEDYLVQHEPAGAS